VLAAFDAYVRGHAQVATAFTLQGGQALSFADTLSEGILTLGYSQENNK